MKNVIDKVDEKSHMTITYHAMVMKHDMGHIQAGADAECPCCLIEWTIAQTMDLYHGVPCYHGPCHAMSWCAAPCHV